MCCSFVRALPIQEARIQPLAELIDASPYLFDILKK
jgi:hypothetical protein